MAELARDKGLEMSGFWLFESPKKDLFARVPKTGFLPPSWWVCSSLYVLRKPV